LPVGAAVLAAAVIREAKKTFALPLVSEYVSHWWFYPTAFEPRNFILVLISQGLTTTYALQSEAGLSLGATVPALKRFKGMVWLPRRSLDVATSST
jgi:hypothetical protein